MKPDAFRLASKNIPFETKVRILEEVIKWGVENDMAGLVSKTRRDLAKLKNVQQYLERN